MAVGGRIKWDEAALAAFLSGPNGPPATICSIFGEKITQEAKRLAPVSPHGSHGRPSGWLRSAIGWELGHDELGVYADIFSPALSVDGAPYGLFQEVGTSKMKAQPHLRPALYSIKKGL